MCIWALKVMGQSDIETTATGACKVVITKTFRVIVRTKSQIIQTHYRTGNT